jgi:hypothetical protein
MTMLGRVSPFESSFRSVAFSQIAAFLFFASFFHGFTVVVAADAVFSVDPSNGQDLASCGAATPCRTINYAMRARRASAVRLSEGTFRETSISFDDSTLRYHVSGLRGTSVIDCGGSGPAFIVSNTSIAIEGVAFQNCANINVQSTGGAVFSHSSAVFVTNCAFYNNTAESGGAVGAISSNITVTSSVFENNTVSCSNTSSACSVWGGAIGTVESHSVTIMNSTFKSNSVNLDMTGVNGIAISAAAGGGCVSVMYNSDANGTRVIFDRNVFTNCAVLVSGSRNSQSRASGVQYGSAYGGAVSIFYGFRAVSLLRLWDAESSFINNVCHHAMIDAVVGIGGNVYGGCLSVNAGAVSVNASGLAPIPSTFVDRMHLNVRNNTLKDCSAVISMIALSNGTNAYGGGVSVSIGAYSYSREGSTNFPGNTSVSSSSYVVSSNTLTNCSATTSTSASLSASSSGSNAYGGGVSFAVGVFSYSNIFGGFNIISGYTNVSSSSYTISSNTLTNCDASSVTSASSSSESFGSNAYGGGVSIAVGAYSYSRYKSKGKSDISGPTSVSSSSYTISNNTLTNCSASSIVSSYSFDSSSSSSLSFSSFSSSSSGSNAYGGGVSVAVGAYSYSYGGFNGISGSTSVSNSNYTISSNTLTNCSASSSTSTYPSSFSATSSASSFGSNAYGGGVAVHVGAYAYSMFINQGGSQISGLTAVSSNSYIISNNTLTNCSASSSTSSDSPLFLASSSTSSSGANAYGGGISFSVCAYSYGRESASEVTGAVLVSNSIYVISWNIIAHCNAATSILGPSSDFSFSVSSSGSSFISSSGSNSYGGGISVAVGVYSYSKGYFSGIPSSTSVSSSSYIISSNTLANCSASSSSSSLSSFSFASSFISSFGSNSYGGGVSVAFGAYSFPQEDQVQIGGIFVTSCIVELFNVSCVNCTSSSSNAGLSNAAFSFGGAISTTFESYVYPRISKSSPSATLGSSLKISNCNFSKSVTSSSASACSPGGCSAAGGALFISILRADVVVHSSFFSDCSVRTGCAAPSSQTYSLGGGVAIFRAGIVAIHATNVTYCRACGVRGAINVLVGGGGVFVQDTKSVSLFRSSISASSVEDAFSVRVVPSGGGAIFTKNISFVQLSNSKIYNNSDSASSGIIVLLQPISSSDLTVSITDGSIISTDLSMSMFLPILNIFCGQVCSEEQQKRIYLNLRGSSLVAQAPHDQRYASAMVLSLPRWLTVSANNSFLNCGFKGIDSIAVLVKSDSNRTFVTCAPCEKPFSVALTSSSVELSSFASLALQSGTLGSCRPLALKSLNSFSDKEQQCPFGFSFCSTVANINVGFWTSSAANGSFSDATRCPSNYCGCRNIPNYKQTSCQIFPPFAVEYQPGDALCNGNRTGILCGGCKPNFTQSLNGFSCISNEVCQQNMGWVWAISVLGYLMYSVYIVLKSLKTKSDGLVMCVLFYGQISSFAGIPPNAKAQSQSAAELMWLSKITQFESVLSLYENSCYGPNMGAYEATLAQLSGPAIVFCGSLLLTAAAGRLQLKFTDLFRTHNLEFGQSFNVVLINVLLLLFSSVTHVIFQLITCVDLQDSVENEPKRVFIDGTKACSGSQYNVLIAASVLLSVAPILFCAGLKFDKISSHTRSVVCSSYTDSRHYWIAVQLVFRFAVTVISAAFSDAPSLAAMAMCICTVFNLLMLVLFRPYIGLRTHCMDVICQAFLVVQFLLQIVARASESMGLSLPEGNRFYNAVNAAALASFILRFVAVSASCIYLLMLSPCRYIPFAVCGVLIVLDVALPPLQKVLEKNGRFEIYWVQRLRMTRRGTNAEPEAAKISDFENQLL